MMKTERYSEEERRQIILKIKEELEKEGFKTTWRNPFIQWLHATSPHLQASENESGHTLYIGDLPVPKIAPFDVAAASLRIDLDRIYFELSLYYSKELEDVIDADAINEIVHRHASDWSGKIVSYFNDIANEFSLEWDTEYDIYIEDTLYGNFPVESADKIISIMKAIKKQSLKGGGCSVFA